MTIPEGRRSERGFTLALMGLDGTGKSTHARRLRERGANSGGTWTVVHHSSTKVPGIGGFKRRFHGHAIRMLKRRHAHVDWSPGQEELPAVRSWIGWALAWYILSGSLLKAFSYRWWFRRSGVILDRCFLDDLVKVQWRFGCRSPLMDFLLSICPKPDVVIVLEGDPAVTYSRKKVQNCTYEEYLGKGTILDKWLEKAVLKGWQIRRIDINGKTVDEVRKTALQILEPYQVMAPNLDTQIGEAPTTHRDDRG